MPFTLLGNGPRLSTPLERDELYKVVLNNGLVIFIASASIPTTEYGTTGRLNYVDPEFLDLGSTLAPSELKDLRDQMTRSRPRWSDSFIDEALKCLVLGADSFKVGSAIHGRWHPLLEPIEEFCTVTMLAKLRPIRSIEEISPEGARHLLKESQTV
ncbi:MAG: hypothetical protein JWN12_332 [Candidatus Saccharibacteria bacterium]|nr:hypothetical protein [Candidatus Saccharibacteria bacterium]